MKALGSSQFFLSLNSFLIQLCIFRIADDKLISTLSVLFLLQMFYFILMRKLTYENQLVSGESSQRPPVIEVWLCMAFLNFIFGFLNNWDSKIVGLVTFFGLLNTILDYKLFSDHEKDRTINILGNFMVSAILILNLLSPNDISRTLMHLCLSIAFYILLFCRAELFRVFEFKTQRIMDVHRGLDFALGSGIGFLLPILVLYQLGNQGVIEIRASQLFVSLINFFSMSLFIQNLRKTSDINIYIYSFSPSVILVFLYLGLQTTDASKIPLLAPIFVHLSAMVYLFIISLVFTQFSNYWLTRLIQVGFQDRVFLWHLKSLPIFLLIYIIGMECFGSLGFALSHIAVHGLDALILRRILVDSKG